MKVQSPINQHKTSFKAGNFYETTAELEKNIVLSRALVDLAGCDVPWIIMANNNQERIERTRRYSIVFLLAFMSPMALVPVLNRFAMKNAVKLTKNFWSNNHKAIHLSNEYLVSAEKTKEGLQKMAKKTVMGPIEAAYYKIAHKKPASEGLNLEELEKSVGGDYEKLRNKILNAKGIVMCQDFLLSGFSLGSMGFINNYLTKRKTGQSGFSAEFKMADSGLVAKRADNYEKNKKKRYAEFTAMTLGISFLLPLALKKGLSAKTSSQFSNFVKKHATKFDYEKGIYMSRIAFLLLMVINHGGLLFASRNKTEFKDNLIRMGGGDVVFFGGDLLIGSVLANLSDRIFKTQLVKTDGEKQSLIKKIFPNTKPINKVNELVNEGKIAAKNKKFATGLYWLNLALVALALGFGIPTLINKIIKKDVSKDVEKEKQKNATPSASNLSTKTPKVYTKISQS